MTTIPYIRAPIIAVNGNIANKHHHKQCMNMYMLPRRKSRYPRMTWLEELDNRGTKMPNDDVDNRGTKIHNDDQD